MKYTAILKDTEKEVEITRLGPHTFHVIIAGVLHEVDARYCSVERLSLLIDQTSHDISFTMDNDDVELSFRNQGFSIKVLDERKMRMRRIRSGLEISGPEIIKTSMPGKVVKIMVKEGDSVEPGSGVIIIEAMKMENEIQCRNSGVVKTVHVTAGQTVESGVALIEIEPESAE